MGRIIQEFWIVTKAGTLLYSYARSDRMDPNILGSIISALNSFAEVLTQGGIQNFEIKETRYYMIKQESLIFLANCPTKVKRKKILNELTDISQKFFNKFPIEFVEKYSHDPNAFCDFDEVIKEDYDTTCVEI